VLGVKPAFEDVDADRFLAFRSALLKTKSNPTPTGTTMIDYAHPTMMAENALKELHKAMLERRYEDAIQAGFRALAETRLAIHAIRETIPKEARDKHDAF
jgi:hypothetical protein